MPPIIYLWAQKETEEKETGHKHKLPIIQITLWQLQYRHGRDADLNQHWHTSA